MLEFPWLNLATGVGVIAGYIYIEHSFVGAQLPSNTLSPALVLCLMVAIGASALGNLILYPGLTALPLEAMVRSLGFTYFLGLILFIALAAIATRIIYKQAWRLALHTVVPAIPLFHFFGRAGCFLAGCCHGAQLLTPVAGLNRVPTQLLEAVGSLCLFAMLLPITRFRLTVYLTGYSILRFVLEFFRADDRGRLLGLFSPSQELAVATVLALTAYHAVRLIAPRLTGHRPAQSITPREG